MKRSILILSLFVLVVVVVNGHLRLWEPPARSTLWRDERFQDFNPAVNEADDGVYCGRILQPLNVTNCGHCGDPFSDPIPRPNESGGTFGRGIIAGNFSMGQEIPFITEITIPHNGSFHIRLCDEIPETDACFFRRDPLVLTVSGVKMTDVPVTMIKEFINGTMKLPEGVSCRQCVLRLNYRSGLMGDCEDGTQDYGCGLQQNFRSCSDISITL